MFVVVPCAQLFRGKNDDKSDNSTIFTEAMKAILGKKMGMTTIYNKEKGALNVTLIQCVPNTVSAVRTEECDGYTAMQLEAPKTTKKTTRREFRMDADKLPTVGDTVTVESFTAGDKISVSGVTKAKGFQGVVKRHGFAGGPASHGHRHALRQAGSIGSAFPQHVIKGKKMAGRMGGENHTTAGLSVALIDVDTNMIAVTGAIPGVIGRMVAITQKTK